jgi:hemoglobin
MDRALNDITDRGDVDRLIARFYERMMVDDVIGYIFTHYAKINLDTHLPIISDFWETILFEAPVYKRGPKAMNVHIDLAKKVPLRKQHFTRWLYLFHQTIDELFAGDRAEKAKERANSIAETIQKRIGALPECGQDAVPVRETQQFPTVSN